jgi:hypothetical protein
MTRCQDNHLVFPAPLNSTSIPDLESICSSPATTLHLSSPPFENFFFSDCHAATQVVVTSPQLDSNLTIIGPRLVVAWPAGNSGVVAFFEPENGINGTLGIQLPNSSIGTPLGSVYEPSTDGNASVGISTHLDFNSTAILSVAILGSIRTIRDFVEGPSLLQEVIQSAINYSNIDGGVQLSRLWLDNITTTTISFTGMNQSAQLGNNTIRFEAGTYIVNVSFNYPQLEQLTSSEVLSPESAGLIMQS